jgi:hypothetical protein
LTTFDPETLSIKHPLRDLTPRLHAQEFNTIRLLRPNFDVAKNT